MSEVSLFLLQKETQRLKREYIELLKILLDEIKLEHDFVDINTLANLIKDKNEVYYSYSADVDETDNTQDACSKIVEIITPAYEFMTDLADEYIDKFYFARIELNKSIGEIDNKLIELKNGSYSYNNLYADIDNKTDVFLRQVLLSFDENGERLKENILSVLIEIKNFQNKSIIDSASNVAMFFHRVASDYESTRVIFPHVCSASVFFDSISSSIISFLENLYEDFKRYTIKFFTILKSIFNGFADKLNLKIEDFEIKLDSYSCLSDMDTSKEFIKILDVIDNLNEEVEKDKFVEGGGNFGSYLLIDIEPIIVEVENIIANIVKDFNSKLAVDVYKQARIFKSFLVEQTDLVKAEEIVKISKMKSDIIFQATILGSFERSLNFFVKDSEELLMDIKALESIDGKN